VELGTDNECFVGAVIFAVLGELHLRNATPDTGREWTDDGSSRERRQLKHRADGDSRIVPVHP
jgi:hypothetical protein